jgi:putative serine protease PepD
VIGINTAIATSGMGGSGNIGVGFAIPVNAARQVADQLIANGRAVHAFLGVALADATGDQQGALVTDVRSDTPASRAGLDDGDIVTKVDQSAVGDAADLSAAVRTHKPGDHISVTYLRDGQSRAADVTLSASTAT